MIVKFYSLETSDVSTVELMPSETDVASEYWTDTSSEYDTDGINSLAHSGK